MGRQDPAARRVSNLTSVQIERKRAIDRANQQHCQRRKKARLQWLEQEVARLSGELGAAEARLRQYEERGCACARKPVVRPVTETIADKTAVVQRSPAVDDAAAITYGGDQWTANLRELLDFSHHDDVELNRIMFEYPLAAVGAHDLPAALPSPTAPSGSLSDSSNTAELAPTTVAGKDSPSRRVSPSLSRVVAFTEPSPPPVTIPASLAAISPFGDIPEWQIVSLHLPPTTDLDRVFVKAANIGCCLLQQQLATGGSAGELSQAQFPNISSLLNPNLGDDETKPLTTALARYVVQKSALVSPTTRIAVMYYLSHLLRWLVCRTRQSYDKLPDFSKPTLLQRTVPHPAWIDVVVWPNTRDALIRDRQWTRIGFSDFRRASGSSMSVNWPHADSGAIIDLGDGQNQVLSPLFEQHIRDIRNWTSSITSYLSTAQAPPHST